MANKITALKLQKRNHQRVNIYLDGEYAFALQRIVAGWLQVGQELSAEKIAQLKADDSREIALQRALRLLDYRPRTESEIRQRLTKLSISAPDIEYVVERLKGNRLLDDRQFTQTWIENRSELRPRSRRALAYELKMHGVDQAIIDQSLASVDDEQMAYSAGLRQARKYETLEWNQFHQKLGRFLAQRGFSYDIIREATRRIWTELSEIEKTPNEEEYP
jgi:regulatory protein